MLIILDGTNLVRRQYHTGQSGSLERTAAKLVERFGGEVVVAWDARQPYWRHELYPDYKAQRADDEQARDFVRQAAKQTKAAGLRGYYAETFEADDVAATIVRGTEDECVVATSDKDWCQLIDDGARWISPERGGFVERTADWVWGRYAVGPGMWPDFVALAGDPSDGIPGVSGVGPVRAAKMLAQYGSSEAYAAAELDKAGAALVALWKRIATLRGDAELKGL